MFAATVLFLAACSDSYTTIDEQTIVPGAKRYDDSVMEDNKAHMRFSRLHKLVSFGLRYSYKLSEENQDKPTYVSVSGKARTNSGVSGGVIAVITHYDNDQLSWMVLPIKIHITDTNTWCLFHDSIYLSPRIDGRKYNTITAVAHLISDKEKFDLDGLHVAIRQRD